MCAARYGEIADIGDENLTPTVIVGEAVGTDANCDPEHLRIGTGRKDGDGVSARLEAMMSWASSLTRTPATPDSCGTEYKYFRDAGSSTSTALLAVCAT